MVSLNVTSASELIDEHLAIDDTDYVDVNLIDENFEQDLMTDVNENDDVVTSEINSKVIYVGPNTEEGNGSENNPYSTLKLACDNVNGEDKVTVNIYDGNYTMGSLLKFDTNNLFINGLGNNVVIKNEFDLNHQTAGLNFDVQEAFSLVSPSANFTISNIIFDATERKNINTYTILPGMPQYGMPDMVMISYFLPFFGAADIGNFNNCSFLGFGGEKSMSPLNFTSNFNNCLFSTDHTELDTNSYLMGYAPGPTFPVNIYSVGSNTNHIFKYSKLNIPDRHLISTVNGDFSITFDSVWFGSNSIPNYVISPDMGGDYKDKIHVTRYAIFSISSNYLGNDEYEIIGKLTWNDGTSDNIDKLGFMEVKLSSDTAEELDKTAIFENGIFRVIYKSNSENNKVIARLDDEEIVLNFIKSNIQLNSPSIYYGDDQNITVKLSQKINSTVNIIINNSNFNKTYQVKVNESDSFNFIIPDILNSGVYDVYVNVYNQQLTDYGIDYTFGFNYTTVIVSKIDDYTFEPIIPAEAKLGEDIIISIELEDDVSGNVIVFVNGDLISKDASSNMEFNISDLVVCGDNIISIYYTGNSKYSEQYFKNILSVENLSSINDNGDNGTSTNSTGNATSGNEASSTLDKTNTNTNKKTTTKKVTKITAKKKTFKKSKKVKKYTITLKSGKNAVKKVKVTLKVGKKTYKAITNSKGKATFKIIKLTKKGKYSSVIKFAGNKNYKAISKKVTITVTK